MVYNRLNYNQIKIKMINQIRTEIPIFLLEKSLKIFVNLFGLNWIYGLFLVGII